MSTSGFAEANKSSRAEKNTWTGMGETAAKKSIGDSRKESLDESKGNSDTVSFKEDKSAKRNAASPHQMPPSKRNTESAKKAIEEDTDEQMPDEDVDIAAITKDPQIKAEQDGKDHGTIIPNAYWSSIKCDY